MKQKGSSDVKGSLWNHLDKKVILWHREAPLFLRVYINNNKKTIFLISTFYTSKIHDGFNVLLAFSLYLIVKLTSNF